MRLPSPYRDETEIASRCLDRVITRLDWPAVVSVGRPWITRVRAHPPAYWALERLLHEYPISSAEGLALMRLAEALLRVPDSETAIALTADQLGRADFAQAGDSLLARLSGTALEVSRRILQEEADGAGLLSRLGAQAVVAATLRALQLLGQQFVLAEDMAHALDRAQSARRQHPATLHSFDMLGEAARSEEDAQRYLAAYHDAIARIAASQPVDTSPHAPRTRDGISIKLSALHPRYEWAQATRVTAELMPRVWQLVEAAARANLNLTLDAEEVERLELSLDLFEALAQRVAAIHPQWQGLGLALQAYQTRALELVDEVATIGRRQHLRFMCRLVKGAYWDAELKRAQELGLPHYPVFTHKSHTDLSWLACAAAMLDAGDVIYPQFASHNAATLAAALQMARRAGLACELQRLHGMGEALFREVLADSPVPIRIYAPVGRFRDLLAYLVRRLLENGANSSFVHQIADPGIQPDALLASPLRVARRSGFVLPPLRYGEQRLNAPGLDLAVADERLRLQQAWAHRQAPQPPEDTPSAALPGILHQAAQAWPAWSALPVERRAACLRRAADALAERLPDFCAQLVAEGRKTWPDALAEVREAIDFLRYYAQQAERSLSPQRLPGPMGERNLLQLRGRGVWVCISPWNFPLAIFIGQVAAALVSGNAVIAKPAEQTPAIAARATALLHAAGIPAEVLQLVCGAGETVGASLAAQPQVAGVAFTGSTAVARHIQRALAAKEGPLVPLIAETGGLNAMIVDSTALSEQVVDAVVTSAFRSAGQRCSALRLLCLQDEIATPVIKLLQGAVAELQVGEPWDFASDVPPLIDADAARAIRAHIVRLKGEAQEIPLSPRMLSDHPDLVAPHLFEIAAPDAMREEVFGPVLHLVRWRGDPLDLVARINALGYGLTLGVQTRIEGRAEAIAHAARVGNVYVNRNMIGAVVGVQPFGGEGLSGTGPKAGGPHYLARFCSELTLTINTAAAGGNASLLGGEEA